MRVRLTSVSTGRVRASPTTTLGHERVVEEARTDQVDLIEHRCIAYWAIWGLVWSVADRALVFNLRGPPDQSMCPCKALRVLSTGPNRMCNVFGSRNSAAGTDMGFFQNVISGLRMGSGHVSDGRAVRRRRHAPC